MTTTQLPSLPAAPTDLVGYLTQNPDKPMVDIFEPYRKFESELRRQYAQEPENEALKDPNINVLPLFTKNTSDIKVRARDPEKESSAERDRYIMALPQANRRVSGSPATVKSLKEFQGNFNVFSESALTDLNWDNVIAAGSSVVNCLLPVPDEYNRSKRSLREYYHEKFCPASDVDLFLYGLTEEQALDKIKEVEASIRDSILSETTVVRTKYAITICSQYPTRHIQIVLRIYKSISEILTGFDIDCSGAAYNGKQVYCTPRALQSYMTQINQIDLSRRSPSYENRLSKYSHRNFEVYWPELDRSRVDPTIFERSFQRTLGLARLLVLEQLPTSSSRETYSAKRREERGRPPINRYFDGRMMRGNIKDDHEDEIAEWVNEDEVSNYHTFTVPYGPKFHAKKIEKLCYTRDLLLNAEWNQPEKREVYLHRHPAFFGRVEDVIHDCCGFCPKAETEQEKEIAEEEGKIYVSGEISFIKDDPGRQQIGSFNPLTEEDWTEMAYVGNTARLCQAIVDADHEHVEDWLAQEGADPNRRDYTGRTPLHLAAMSSSPQVVRLLVDHGARLVARVADGRTALHLAAERGNSEIVKIIMEKSISNEAEEEEKQDKRRQLKTSSQSKGDEEPQKEVESDSEDAEDDSDGELIDDDESDEGQSMATGSFVKVRKGEEEKTHDDVVPEEEENDPDFYDVNVIAWDTPSSALHLAIVSGHDEVVKVLCQEYGADVLLPVKFLGHNNQPTAALLTLVLALSLPVEKAKSMAKTLLSLGATCAQADLHGITAFHRYVEDNASALLETLWELDRTGSQTAINHMAFPDSYKTTSPLIAAVSNGDIDLTLRLLDSGAAAQIDFETWLKSAKRSSVESRLRGFEENTKLFNSMAEQPLLAALKSADPSIAVELLKRGADPNVITPRSHSILQQSWWRGYEIGQSALDIVREQLEALRKYDGESLGSSKPVDKSEEMDKFIADFEQGSWQYWMVSEDIKRARNSYEERMKNHEKEVARVASLKGVSEKKAAIAEIVKLLEEIESMIVQKGGKIFDELHPDFKNKDRNNNHYDSTTKDDSKDKYDFVFSFGGVTDVTKARHAAYIDLFEAAWQGDLDKIKSLTLAAWDDDKKEPPLKIALSDNKQNNPFSLAFLRGHHDVAQAILEIAQAQWSPEEAPNTRFTMQRRDDDSDCYDSDEARSESDDEEPRIYREIVDNQFTIENIGEVSMQVKSRVKAIDLLAFACPSFVFRDGKEETVTFQNSSLLRFVIEQNDHKGLKFLLDMGTYFTGKNLDPEEEPSRFYTFPDEAFNYAVSFGRTEMLSTIIKRTGAGLPLEDLVKRTGVEMKEKPRYYQGLTVYGKKRKDWAQAGRGVVQRSSGSKLSPLIPAAMAGSIESVEWFLSDAPMRHYMDFAKSKAAREDPRLKHLSQAPGGFDRAITRWLGNQNDLVIHAAIMCPDEKKSKKLVEYLIKSYPTSMITKSKNGYTPFYLAAVLGRTGIAKLLIDNDANQAIKDSAWDNIVHAALKWSPESDQLQGLLDVFDSELRTHCFRDRSNLSSSGQTPLHRWLADNVRDNNSYNYGNNKKYDTTDKFIEVLKLLLKYSEGRELEMLDGAGDTPLHLLITREAELDIIRVLLDFNPQLLYRENAVGRTPAEVARDKFVSARISTPASHYNHQNNSVSNMVGRAPETFVDAAETKNKATSPMTRSRKEEIWDLVQTYMDKYPGKRKLVSLHEANDVAKRLGDKYQTQRYGVRAKAEEAEGGAAVKGVEDEYNKSDFVTDAYWTLKDKAWVRPKKSEYVSKGSESEDY